MTSAIQVRTEDLPILVSLAHGHSWTTACDLAQLTPEQRRQTAARLRLAIEPANGRVRKKALARWARRAEHPTAQARAAGGAS